MKSEANEAVDLSFECGIAGAGLTRHDHGGLSYLRHETISGKVAKTTTGRFEVPPGTSVLCINYQGSIIARPTSRDRLVLIPPRSLTYIRHSHLTLQAGRGDHHAVLISWQNNVASLLEAWLQSRARSQTGGVVRSMACKPIDWQFQPALERYEKVISEPSDLVEPMIAAFLYEIVSHLTTGLDKVQIAAAPLDLPETVADLIKSVRADPAYVWSLRDAAARAGYSQFHFSRVFKALVGYGFHEYVDRCRTEVAVEFLCSTDHPVDIIASTCGFGTTQGMREAVKKYLGFVPSELRNSVEAFSPMR